MGQKGISKYPDLDYNKIIYCKCGCGTRLTIKLCHKYFGYPIYVSGHAFPKIRSKEHRAKISKALKGIPKSEATKVEVTKNFALENDYGFKLWTEKELDIKDYFVKNQ